MYYSGNKIKLVYYINSDNKIKLVSILFYFVESTLFLYYSGNKIKLVYYINSDNKIKLVIILFRAIEKKDYYIILFYRIDLKD